MLQDLAQTPQQAFGTQPHWAMLHQVMADPVIFAPIQTELVQIVSAEIARNPGRPVIHSRLAVAKALENVDSTWHAQFPRRFPHFANGADRGVSGMALWHHIVNRPDLWCFDGVADPYGSGQDSKVYWRI